MKNLPSVCPACSAALHVHTLGCSACDTGVSGDFVLPLLARMGAQEQRFVLDFVKASGSLKVMAQQLGLSYPTVRNLLDALINTIERDELNHPSL